MTTTKPTAADIKQAIANIEGGHWLDSSVTPVCWGCILYEDGKPIGGGKGHTAAEVMGVAWVNHWAPDALDGGPITPVETEADAKTAGFGTVPLMVGKQYRFEFIAPDQVDDNGVAVDKRPFLPPWGSDEFDHVVRQAIRRNPGAVSIAGAMLQALAGAKDGMTILEINEAVADGPPPPGKGPPDPDAIVELILRDYRLPLMTSQAFIRHGFAAAVARLQTEGTKETTTDDPKREEGNMNAKSYQELLDCCALYREIRAEVLALLGEAPTKAAKVRALEAAGLAPFPLSFKRHPSDEDTAAAVAKRVFQTSTNPEIAAVYQEFHKIVWRQLGPQETAELIGKLGSVQGAVT